MIFYDEDVVKYTVRFSPYKGKGIDREEVIPEAASTAPRVTYRMTYRYIGGAMLEYLNEKTALGIRYEVRGHTEEQLRRFRAHLPTEDEEEKLRRLLDEVIVPAGRQRPLPPDARLTVEDIGPLNMGFYVDTDNFLGIQLSARSLYGLYLYECYKILDTQTLIVRCPHCGRYFRQRTSKADFCSNKCRNAYHNENSSSIYKQYRRAYDRNGKYINNPCHVSTPDEWGAFEQWKWEAKEARKQREAGLITKAEFDAVIERNIFGRKRKRRSPGADTDSTGGADDAIHKEENE